MAYSQNKLIEKADRLAEAGNLQEAETILQKIDAKRLHKSEKGHYYRTKARLYEYKNIIDSAYFNYIKAKKEYQASGDTPNAMEINPSLAYILAANNKNVHGDAETYLNDYLSYALKMEDSLLIAKAYTEIASFKLNPNSKQESLEYFLKAMKINKIIDNKELQSTIDNNLAALYNEYIIQYDSALYYFNKDLIYLKKQNNRYGICVNLINQSTAYTHLKKYRTALKYLMQADSVPVNKNRRQLKYFIYSQLALNYQELHDYESAFNNMTLAQAYADTLRNEEQSIAINDIQTKYKTKEKELENQLLRSDNETNRILIYTFTGLLTASLVIGFLVFKNARRKEKILKQEKLIEQQKLEKALKDYELQSIDIMLEGQEKERQRIANDLHDNLGSMLATLKLNFENLKIRKNELREDEDKLYQKTDELIEEAYQKVRRMAHAKNAGVFASEGLIPTLKKLAEKISIPGKLSIEVNAFGFNERLENKMEIAIFRMVQELSTNIIKHSRATEASVQLTNHDDNINIIIEDNGIGMDISNIGKADGMGLDSIKKKAEQLGGTFTIDSKKGKGTTIIIDMPI
jgi:hypothetical protein